MYQLSFKNRILYQLKWYFVLLMIWVKITFYLTFYHVGINGMPLECVNQTFRHVDRDSQTLFYALSNYCQFFHAATTELQLSSKSQVIGKSPNEKPTHLSQVVEVRQTTTGGRRDLSPICR